MVNIDQLRTWAGQGESETQEFKETTGQRSEAVKSLSAMLNTRGGRVLFGINSRGVITGQQITDKTVEDVVQEIRQHVEPPVFPTLERVSSGADREVLVVSVDRGSRRPYTYRGKAYRRVGTTNLEMTREDYNRIVLEQHHGTIRWENEPASGWDVADLETTEVVRTLDEAIRRGRADDPGTRDSREILRGFGLIKDGQVLRSAVVLFARAGRLLPDFPQCLLRVARFKGIDRSEFLDNRQFHGHAFDLLRHAERFLRDNLPIAGRIVPNLFERSDDPLYPPEALREALANAICHRDYAMGGGSVGLAIYDDRLEITSSGMLHFGLTIEDLYQPHESLPWNPLIASVFYKRGIIETWGRGTLKIVELTRRAGLPKPQIEISAGAVVVRFLPSRYLPPQRIGHDLTPRQQAILRILGATIFPGARQLVRRSFTQATFRTGSGSSRRGSSRS
jgi:ATP-dependent DNA helicase RecG